MLDLFKIILNSVKLALATNLICFKTHHETFMYLLPKKHLNNSPKYRLSLVKFHSRLPYCFDKMGSHNKSNA